MIFFSQNLLIPASPKIPQGVKYANTPKLYTTNGGITGECKVFCSRLATLLLIKDRAEIREKERKLTLLY